ncbi:hypothetical protein JRQ81_012267 [Phrynocephalus forsythii]|uniref:Ig-like domain-containing protein n=1 Tax=Phrynocephalus forsythii TaxID=171643 RepID=A0A9Q0X640_9SAUR|nr:hypothetical protein JRQ81_012267 [Phrynocephalus forsythii]
MAGMAGVGGASSLALGALLLALLAAAAVKESGEFLQSFDEEEVFHVDWAQKENVWRLPALARQMDFKVQGALGNLAVLKTNLEIMRRRTNQTRAQNVPPSATMVYPKDPVELGEPNVLVCFVDKFSPPVLNITWLKNGQQVISEGCRRRASSPARTTLSASSPTCLSSRRRATSTPARPQAASSCLRDARGRAVWPGLDLWHPGGHCQAPSSSSRPGRWIVAYDPGLEAHILPLQLCSLPGPASPFRLLPLAKTPIS